MSKVELKDINKIYPNGVQAVFDFNLTIDDGEFIVLVGPSGCGKSTTLRMIAGLESISSGDFKIDGDLMNNVAPVDRNIAMVFQNYALYSHMTVYENVGISLKINHNDKLDSHHKIKAASNKLELNNYLNRLPTNLSGGQCQRVALGRAIVRDPKMFLMDEPLSNLDAKLREKTRSEIVKLQKDLGVTTLYVTHDQIEAMTMADRMVVMKDGYVQQIDSPFQIYNFPANIFVASFIGTPTMNFIEGTIIGNDFVTSTASFPIPANKIPNIHRFNNMPMVLGIRPEGITADKLFFDNNLNFPIFDLNIIYSEFLGNTYDVRLDFENISITSKIHSRDMSDSSTIKVMFDLNKCHFFDKVSTNRVSEV